MDCMPQWKFNSGAPSFSAMNDFANARVAHSVLHPEWIAQVAEQRYELSGRVDAFPPLSGL